MKHRLTHILLVAFTFGVCSGLTVYAKPRVIVLTDIQNEPDDARAFRFRAA
jgi:hypothetical protein